MREFFGPAELDALRLSLAVATRSVLWSLPLAVLVAWLLTRARFHGRMLFDAFVHLPLVLPPVAVGYVLLVLFGTRGPFGRWLYEHFGVELAFSTNGAALATAVMTFRSWCAQFASRSTMWIAALRPRRAPWERARSIASRASRCR